MSSDTVRNSCPSVHYAQNYENTSYDQIEADQRLNKAARNGLFSDCIGLVGCEVGKTKPFSIKPLQAVDKLTHFLQVQRDLKSCTGDLAETNSSPSSTTDGEESTKLVIIPQRYSRGPLDISLSGLKCLLENINAFPAASKTIAAFTTSGSDSYLAKNNVHFSPHIDSSNQVLEFTCLLKYVEKHDRKGDLIPWSVRLLGLYQRWDPLSLAEIVILIHPSDATWTRTRHALKDNENGSGTWQHWTRLLLLVFASVLDGWQEYVTFLYDKMDEVEISASFTDPKRITIGEVTHESLKDCLAHMNVLRTASQALADNIRVFETALSESRRCKMRTSAASTAEDDMFESATESFARELTSMRAHLDDILERRQQTVGEIRDLVSMRNSHTIEKLSERAFFEARAVRIITVVTLLFLPATFASEFMNMEFVHVVARSSSGILKLSAEPGLYLYLAIALPLTAATLLVWLAVEWNSSRKSRPRDSHIV